MATFLIYIIIFNMDIHHAKLNELIIKHLFHSFRVQKKDGKIYYDTKHIYTFKKGEYGFNVIKNLTIDESIDIAYKITECYKDVKNKESIIINIELTLENIKQTNNIGSIVKDIAIMKDNMQNTTDVVNLFTDIDKNRISTDNRIDKLEQKINNIEANIGQILFMLQKK